jgi:hypothetical protein
MEKSYDIFVTSASLARVSYDSGRRVDIVIPLYGVRDTGWPRSWVWSTERGPLKSPTPEWFKTEDGREFQKFIDDLMNDIDN